MEYKIFVWNIFLIVPLFGLSISEDKDPKENESDFSETSNFPKYNRFGQISAVSTDTLGNIYVFHRGNQEWTPNSFSSSNVFSGTGPIVNETIVVLDPVEGTSIQKTGRDIFYLPHGLTVDHENNIWVTDVALHQVFKFPPIDLSQKGSTDLGKPSLTLGVRFTPGNDDYHFCKPTDVAVDRQTNEFYVSDGYCNARIIKFDQFGKKLLQWGRKVVGMYKPDFYMLNLPHGLALAQDQKTLYVADRENFRVVSYDSESGKFKRSYAEELRSEIFSVAYSSVEGGLVFALTNSTLIPKTVSVYSAETGKFLSQFSPEKHFTNPHDLIISPNGQYCYVVELNPPKLWRFKRSSSRILQVINNHPQASETSSKPSSKPEDVRAEEPVPAESKINKTKNFEVSSSFLAAGLVASIVVISCLFFMFHYYKRKGYRRYESRRLILDDDEEGGIRLT